MSIADIIVNGMFIFLGVACTLLTIVLIILEITGMGSGGSNNTTPRQQSRLQSPMSLKTGRLLK